MTDIEVWKLVMGDSIMAVFILPIADFNQVWELVRRRRLRFEPIDHSGNPTAAPPPEG